MQVLEPLFVRIAWFWTLIPKIPFKTVKTAFKNYYPASINTNIYIFQNKINFKIKACFELLLERVEEIRYKELLNKDAKKEQLFFTFISTKQCRDTYL